MGQSQANGHSDHLQRQQHGHQHQHHSQPRHPTSEAFARVADFVDANGVRLLTEGGFAELFGSRLVPALLARATWLASAAGQPGRGFLTAADLAELHDRLAGGGGGRDAGRQLLAALLVQAGLDAAVAADAVLETGLGSAQPQPHPECLREALTRLLRLPSPLPDDVDASVDPAAAAAEIARLALRHLPHLMTAPIAALLACLRSPLPPTPGSLLLDSGPPLVPPPTVTEPWLGWALACQLPPSFAAGMPTAQLLYDTDVEVRSPSRLAQLVFDYGGPTLLLATTDDLRLFCVAADRGFREAWEAYGDSDCRLTQLLPELRILLSGAGILYANLRASVGRRGVSVGRNPGQAEPVLLVGPELDTVSVFGVPTRLSRLRAVGLGDPGLVERLRAERERDQRLVAIARDRKLKIQQDGHAGSAGWEQNVDRQLLEWGGVRNAGGNARLADGREAELGLSSDAAGGGNSSDGGPSRLLKPEF